MKVAVFWDMMPCDLSDINISEESTTFIVYSEGGSNKFFETLANVYQTTCFYREGRCNSGAAEWYSGGACLEAQP